MNNFLFFLTLLALGFFFGKRAEKNHFKSILKREKYFASLPVSSRKKTLPTKQIDRTDLVQGGVVISIDFFKKTLSAIINLFGGNITPYESLVGRARREAVLRLQESCPDADEILNLRIETSSITKSDDSIGAIEVLAYGTAIYYETDTDQPLP